MPFKKDISSLNRCIRLSLPVSVFLPVQNKQVQILYGFFFIVICFLDNVSIWVQGSVQLSKTTQPKWRIIFWRRGDSIRGLKPLIFVFDLSYIKEFQNGQATLVSSWKNLLRKLHGEGESKWAGIAKDKHDMIISLHQLRDLNLNFSVMNFRNSLAFTKSRDTYSFLTMHEVAERICDWFLLQVVPMKYSKNGQ